MHNFLVQLNHNKRIIYTLAVFVIALACYGVYLVLSMIYFISTSSANYASVYIRPSDNGLIISTNELDLTKKVKQLPTKTNILLQMDSGQKNAIELFVMNEEILFLVKKLSGILLFQLCAYYIL